MLCKGKGADGNLQGFCSLGCPEESRDATEMSAGDTSRPPLVGGALDGTAITYDLNRQQPRGLAEQHYIAMANKYYCVQHYISMVR